VVEIGRDLLDKPATWQQPKLEARKRVAVVTDENVGPLYGEKVMGGLEAAGKEPVLVTVPAGEATKSLRWAEEVLSQLARAGLDRKSLVVALGGGVIGDLAGFCAAVYQRGVPYVQIPTTVLSQVDSSVGGKTGVNLPDAKNMVGSFHQPVHVLADVGTLNSLPKREWNEGFAEIIKHACIRDESMLQLIEEVQEGRGDVAELIRANVAIKAAIVEEDEFETIGTRALLNFGHTLGHAIEAAAGYGKMLHGEAISLGLRAAAWLSVQLAELPVEDYDRIVALLRRFELPVVLEPAFQTEELLRISRMDKKFDAGGIRFVLLRRLGEGFLSRAVTEEDLRRALDEVRR
jgi:3-dehydroquinate synthase